MQRLILHRTERTAFTVATTLFALTLLTTAQTPAKKEAERASGPAESDNLVTNSIGMKFVLIPAGEFLMGSPETDHEAGEDERPRHKVRITKPFDMSIYETTRGDYRLFARVVDAERARQGLPADDDTVEGTWGNPGFKQTDDHPVVNVSWYDATNFCKWLSKKEGKRYRLPTEAEWEYACRAGTRTRFSGGDSDKTLAEVANVADAAAKSYIDQWYKDYLDRQKLFGGSKPNPKPQVAAWNDGYEFTAPVGSFKPNDFGLYDMHGNAGEWCSDLYDAKYYRRSPADDPPGPSEGQQHVIRIGAWDRPPGNSRSAGSKLGAPPQFRKEDVGFRVVLEIP